MLDRTLISRIALTGCLTAATALAAFVYDYYVNRTVQGARNAAFSVLVISELLRSFGARSPIRTIWEIGLFSNIRLLAVVAVSFALQVGIVTWPMLQKVFGTAAVSPIEWLAWIALSTGPLITLEALKFIRRRAFSTAVEFCV